MNAYKILTDRGLYDLDFENGDEEAVRLAFFEEQIETLKKHGYEFNRSNDYYVHLFESDFHYERKWNMTLYDALDILAVKDGIDLVQFDNGNVGFVAYYNGRENGFEILGDAVCEEDEDDPNPLLAQCPELQGLPLDFFWNV